MISTGKDYKGGDPVIYADLFPTILNASRESRIVI